MKLLVLDGNSIVNRAYYGIKLLSTKEGVFTNGIYGFLNILEKIKEETKPDAVAVAFDLKAPTFRHKMYDKYKAGRKGMPEELAMQMPILKELLEYLGYTLVSLEGYEADDILGTLSRVCEEKGDSCVIATGDRDSLQLVSEHTNVRLASTKFGQSTVTIYDIEKIEETYGVKPLQLIDIKAIQGDSSDNIPGVAGIGEKGAGELIKKFDSLSYIYENLETLDIRETMKKKLVASKENALMSYELGTICREVPIDTNIESYKISEMQRDKVTALMTKLELFKLMDKMGINANEIVTEEVEQTEITVKEITQISSVLPMLEDKGKAYFVQENDCLYFENNGEILKVCANDMFLKSFAKNTKIEKYCSDVKAFQKLVKSKTGEDVKNVKMDLGLAGYLLNPSSSSYDVERLCAEFSVSLGKSEDKSASSCASLPSLCKIISEKIEENKQSFLLNDVEIPLALVLADMELEGFAVDKEGIKDFGKTLKADIDKLGKSIIEQVGYEFNINSPKQLGEALFVKLELPHGKKTKTGYSTNAEVLENLRYRHPVVEDILSYRTLTKLNSTYCVGLLKALAEDGRIHSSFNQTETRTGRISSTEPNLQNIPVRTSLGANLRKFFVAKEDWVLVDADYSQIELRVLAHVSKDKVMIDAFNSGKDIHKATAAKVFNMPEDFVTTQMRSSAKAVNFGIVYGIGAFSLSKDIGVTRKEAEDYINEYLRNFGGVKDYMDEIIANAKEKGYAEDIFGRRRYLPELSSSNFNMRAFGERVARNMPIQGAAADIIKIAMVKVSNRLKEEKLQAKLILQVHDELIVECPEIEKEKVIAILEEEMKSSADMSVAMIAEAKSGKTWYEAK
ncbi:MAG: DNA polymerase I [Clostridia bacterium]